MAAIMGGSDSSFPPPDTKPSGPTLVEVPNTNGLRPGDRVVVRFGDEFSSRFNVWLLKEGYMREVRGDTVRVSPFQSPTLASLLPGWTIDLAAGKVRGLVFTNTYGGMCKYN